MSFIIKLFFLPFAAVSFLAITPFSLKTGIWLTFFLSLNLLSKSSVGQNCSWTFDNPYVYLLDISRTSSTAYPKLISWPLRPKVSHIHEAIKFKKFPLGFHFWWCLRNWFQIIHLIDENYAVTKYIIFSWPFGSIIMVTTFFQPRIRMYDHTNLYL